MNSQLPYGVMQIWHMKIFALALKSIFLAGLSQRKSGIRACFKCVLSPTGMCNGLEHSKKLKTFFYLNNMVKPQQSRRLYGALAALEKQHLLLLFVMIQIFRRRFLMEFFGLSWASSQLARLIY